MDQVEWTGEDSRVVDLFLADVQVKRTGDQVADIHHLHSTWHPPPSQVVVIVVIFFESLLQYHVPYHRVC